MTTDDAIALRDYMQDRFQDADTHTQRNIGDVKTSLDKLWEIHGDYHKLYVSLPMFQSVLDQRFESVDRIGKQIIETVDFRFLAIEKATALATVAIEHRLEGMNEFRGQLNDVLRTLLSKAEYDAKHQDLITRIDVLAASLQEAKNQHYTFIAKPEHDAYAKEVTLRFDVAEKARGDVITRVETLEKFYANLQGRIWALGIGVTIFSIAIAAVLHFIPV